MNNPPPRATPNHRPLWKLSIVTAPEAEDAVIELLQNTVPQPVSSWTDLDTATTTVSAYLPAKPRDSSWRPRLAAGLRQIRENDIDTGPGTVSLRKLPPENWAASWKRHFKPLEISPRLLIKPSWSRQRPRRNQAVVILDPGLSFGTGQHPTTGFCLRELAAQRHPGQPQAFLDIGSGSGILAIAAAKLGYAPVHAFDSDPDAVRIARSNARHNRVLHKIHIRLANLATLTTPKDPKFDIICANLTSDLLIAERKRIVSRLRKPGILVLAGILGTEFAAVKYAFERQGFTMMKCRHDKSWTSGTFFFVNS